MFDAKLISKQELKKIISSLHTLGKTVVFTNGCFDLLHYGHAKYLEAAKARGDVLVVAINSDSSVRTIKGPKRPIVKFRDRARLVASLASVDYVVKFKEKTPLELISYLKPDVLVKGGDWKEKDIVGACAVRRRGGTVASIPFVKGFSSTRLIKKIAKTF